MELPEEVVKDARRRLHRAQGQLEAVDRMLSEGQECKAVMMQLSAATKALEQVGFKILAAGLTYCVEHPAEAAEEGYPLEEIQRMFMRLA